MSVDVLKDSKTPLMASPVAPLVDGRDTLIDEEAQAGAAKPEGRKALCVSIVTLLLSIPALIGA